jgi:type I restriction enzyme, R subunit
MRKASYPAALSEQPFDFGFPLRDYRNDALPRIAVTVCLLTTGIDVPKITNLVFLRRVNSRILYEQMLGRATRLCPEIGKQPSASSTPSISTTGCRR